jgi:hypothetical protein
MAVLLAVLISGVLLDANDKPMPKYQLVFTDGDLKVIKVMTDENGKFQVDLEPGTYRSQFGPFTTVRQGQKTCVVNLRARPEPLKTPAPCIEIIWGKQRADVILPKGPRG